MGPDLITSLIFLVYDNFAPLHPCAVVRDGEAGSNAIQGSLLLGSRIYHYLNVPTSGATYFSLRYTNSLSLNRRRRSPRVTSPLPPTLLINDFYCVQLT